MCMVRDVWVSRAAPGPTYAGVKDTDKSNPGIGRIAPVRRSRLATGICHLCRLVRKKNSENDSRIQSKMCSWLYTRLAKGHCQQ